MIAQTKIIDPWCLQITLMKVLLFFKVLLWLCNTPLGFNRYVMEFNRFPIYPKRGIAHALNNYGHKQYPSNSLTKIIQSMVFIKYLHVKVLFSFQILVWLYNTPPRFNKYVMEPKKFLIYLNKGIARALSSNFGHEQYPFDSLYQKKSTHGVYKIPS